MISTVEDIQYTELSLLGSLSNILKLSTTQNRNCSVLCTQSKFNTQRQCFGNHYKLYLSMPFFLASSTPLAESNRTITMAASSSLACQHN